MSLALIMSRYIQHQIIDEKAQQQANMQAAAIISSLLNSNKVTANIRPTMRYLDKPFEEKLASDSSKAAGYWVPGEGISLNASGNMTKGQIAQIAAGLKRTGKYADVFVGVPVGHPSAPYGIWGRKLKGRGKNASAGIVPLLIRVSAPSYRKRFDFEGIAKKNAQRIFNEEFDRAFRQAMASAR